MLKPVLTSLRLQISLAFLLLAGLFAGASLYTLAAFERQVDYDAVVDIAARLELTVQQMHVQAINYKQNAPRDYPTYYRDLRLYYQDLMAQMTLFDEVVDGFMSGDLSRVGRKGAATHGEAEAGQDAEDLSIAETVHRSMPRVAMDHATPWLKERADAGLRSAIERLERRWASFRGGLLDAIGDDLQEPRLEWAAEHVLAQHARLEQASRALSADLRRWAQAEHERVGLVAFALIAGTLLTGLAILMILNASALKPLQRAIAGVQRVAEGDFGHTLSLQGASEVRALAGSFNVLSGRLHLLFLLIDRLQRGNDLDDVVGFLGKDFGGLLRFDWIGVVLVNPDNATARLEASALDGEPEVEQPRLFRLRDTLLEKALRGGGPMHIADMAITAAANPRYEFLRDLIRRGLADAVFLPVAADTPTPAVVAFATRAPGQYDAAQMAFLGNIAQLITASFGRTVRVAERARLAAIGEFASGIAHELRSPLATLTLAVDYFSRQEQPPNARKRLELASAEAGRMGRLIDDMLLYAKPLRLTLAPLKLTRLVSDAIELQREQPAFSEAKIRFSPAVAPDLLVLGDRDRLLQVLANLLRNACEASCATTATANSELSRDGIPADGSLTRQIRVSISSDHIGTATIDIDNAGPPIPAGILARAFEPFVSARQGGTGLGLAIVQRLVALHGGDVELTSSAESGTRARLRLPLAEPPA